MTGWKSTCADEATNGLIALLHRKDWSESAHGTSIRDAVLALLEHEDDTTRMLAAPALPALTPATFKDQLRARLTTEDSPAVRGQLVQLLLTLPARDIDELLADMSRSEIWPALTADPEPAEHDPDYDADIDDFFVRLLIQLDLRHQQPFAHGLLDSWMTAPLDHSQRASRACILLRNYLNAPPPTATRAFALLKATLPDLTMAWRTASSIAPESSDEQRVRARADTAVKLAESLAHELHLASGGLAYGDARPQPASDAFAAHAFPLLEDLAAISHPTVVHEAVQTLAHMRLHDPRRVILAIASSATPSHEYQWEGLAADMIVSVVDVYAAEHRNLLVADPECLTALRRLLEGFVRAGWEQAIERALAIDELLR